MSHISETHTHAVVLVHDHLAEPITVLSFHTSRDDAQRAIDETEPGTSTEGSYLTTVSLHISPEALRQITGR